LVGIYVSESFASYINACPQVSTNYKW